MVAFVPAVTGFRCSGEFESFLLLLASTGYSKLNNFTSDQPHPQNMFPNVSAKKSLVKVTACDPKGKAVAALGNQETKRMALKQWIKDNYISSPDQDQPDLVPIPLGEKCQLCAIDLGFLP
ncbi:uncharacterized protein LOC144557321 [Carex rostrata]